MTKSLLADHPFVWPTGQVPEWWPERKPTKKYVNAVLARSFTPVGVDRWWDRPMLSLDNKTPREFWGEGRKVAVVLCAEACLDQNG